MNRKDIIDAQFNSVARDSYFERGSFRLEYCGTNRDGSHDDFIDCKIYEYYSDQNVNSSNFHEPLLKYLCKPQFAADVFPYSLTDPDSVRELYEFGADERSCTISIWNEKADLLEIDLKPVYEIVNFILVYSRWTETVSVHEAHMLCKTIPL